MNKKLLALAILPLLIAGCNSSSNTDNEYPSTSVEITHKVGDIGSFNLLSPENGFSTNQGFTFTWEEASNAETYQIEISATENFYNDKDAIYVKESNISINRYDLNFNLPKKDILYYWRVTAVNSNKMQRSNQVGNFFYESVKVGELEIEIEDEQDWVIHKEGSQPIVSIDRNNFFNNGKDSLVINFDKEHTLQGIPSSDGWIVITKTEDRELYGTDAFYFNFFYSGHDSTVLIRVLDYDGEYWHNQVKISNNAKQTILMKYSDFSLRTAGTNVFNRVFDWEHIRYFEIVFEKTFGDGVCVISNIKAVQYDNYKNMFMEKMDFKSTNMADWTYENFNFPKTVSEDGSELTLMYEKKTDENPNGFNGYGFQNVDLYKYFASGDAIRLKVKYTGSSSGAIFYFRVLEEDTDRWQFKVPFSYLIQNDYKELVVPLKSFQRTDYMQGDGAKQFYFIKKLNFGLAENYASGTLSIKDVEIVTINDPTNPRKRVVTDTGCIEDFSTYDIYTKMYYYWDQSSANKDEAMKLDTAHKPNIGGNAYCGEFDYKADMEAATYQIYLDTTAAQNKNAFQIYLRDATPKPTDSVFSYLKVEDVSAEMTIQLTMDTGEWYRYTIKHVGKDWTNYTIAFKDFELYNKSAFFTDPSPLTSNRIIHMGFAFQYFFYDSTGKSHPTYAIANPVYLDEIYLTNAEATSVEVLDCMIREDDGVAGQTTIDTLESFANNTEFFGYWSYLSQKDYNSMELSNVVSSEGGIKSVKMHYKGYESVSYGRSVQFSYKVQANALSIDIKADGKATIYLNLNIGTFKERFSIVPAMYDSSTGWYRYVISFDKFTIVSGSGAAITASTAKNIDTISFGIVNNDYSASDIYVDNIRFLNGVASNTLDIDSIA